MTGQSGISWKMGVNSSGSLGTDLPRDPLLNPLLFSLVSHIVAPHCWTLTAGYCFACTGTSTNRQRPMVGKELRKVVHLHGCPRFSACLPFLFFSVFVLIAFVLT